MPKTRRRTEAYSALCIQVSYTAFSVSTSLVAEEREYVTDTEL